MARNSSIEWTHHTFNAWWGCNRVSPACDHCYAAAIARRFHPGRNLWGPDAEYLVFDSPAHWDEPLRWDRAAAKAGVRERVFAESMGDVFDNRGPAAVRERLWALIRSTPNLDWMLLTKRVGNIRRFLPADWGGGYRNVWLGCTVCNQVEADRDVVRLLSIPARVHWVSYEPMLGGVDFTRLGGERAARVLDALRGTLMSSDSLSLDPSPVERVASLDLIVSGGESGPGARPWHPQHLLALIKQCEASGTAHFHKQHGAWLPIAFCSEAQGQLPGRVAYVSLDGSVHADRVCDSDELVVKVGKERAGRTIRGRTFSGMPNLAVRAAA